MLWHWYLGILLVSLVPDCACLVVRDPPLFLELSAAVFLDCFSCYYMYHFERLRLVTVAVLGGLLWLWLGKVRLLSVCSLMVGLVSVLQISVCFGVDYAASVPISVFFNSWSG
jgi:hypothetical protein